MPDSLKNIHPITLRDLAGGQKLRNFRRRIARHGQLASQDPKSVLTTKFQLELNDALEGLLTDFNLFRETYDVEQGAGKDTLANFLFAVILSGFRIFPSAGDAKDFLASSAYDEAGFSAAVEKAVKAPLPRFTVANVFGRLSRMVRSNPKKDAGFVKEVVIREYRKALCPKVPAKADQEVVNRIFDAIADELIARFSGWADVCKNLPKAASAVDDALSKFGSFPSLRKMADQATADLPKFSTIVCDPSIPFTDISTLGEFVPHACVRTILGYPECKSREVEPAFVQKSFTSGTPANGLSWLFNRGMLLFREKSVQELCNLFGVSLSEAHRIEQVKTAACSVPDQSLFYIGDKPMGWHAFRVSVQGRLDSWIANYLKRLGDLAALTDSVPVNLKLPNLIQNGQDFVAVADCDRSEIDTLLPELAAGKPAVQSALQILQGRSPGSVRNAAQTVEEYQGVCARLTAVREKLLNVLEQHSRDKASPWKNLYGLVKADFEPWKNLQTLPKLNKLSGGVPNANSELSDTLAHFAAVHAGFEKHRQDLLNWASAQNLKLDVVGAAEEVELNRAGSRIQTKAQAEELAVRRILQSLALQVRDRKDALADAVRSWFGREGIFASTRDFNRFFNNREGTIYKSPFSTRKHQPYTLGKNVISNGRAIWQSFSNLIQANLSRWPDFTPEAETLLRLRAAEVALTVRAIGVSVPKSVADFRLTAAELGDAVPEEIRLMLRQPTVPARILGKVFNLYVSLLSGDLILLRREKFYLRTKFQWMDNTELCYVPKEKAWHLPARYENSAAWKPILEEKDLLVFNADKTAIDTVATFGKICGSLKNPVPGLGKLLRQLPHDWCYRLPLRPVDTGAEKTVLVLSKHGSKGMVLSAAKTKESSLCRLVGPSSLKGRLDEFLINRLKVLGDMTLLVDEEVSQNVGNGTVSLKEERMRFSLALPIAEFMTKAVDEPMPFTRIVAIDQGEVGVGYAVFELDDAGNPMATPIVTGTVRIPSIRALIRSVNSYRKKGQKVEKFNQRFDSTMFTLRENVAGDVCGVIAGLMERFNAFPVLEKNVKNLASGSKQLSLVYKMVNARFLSDGVQAHTLERAAWWNGVKRWEIPGFLEEVSQDFFKKYKKNGWLAIGTKYYRPLAVYPGAGVPAAGTSQTCSCCGRNLFSLLDLDEAGGIKKLTLDGNGETVVHGETVRLFARPSNKERHKALTRNERPDWNDPLSNVTLTIDEFRRRAKENIRRPPKSLQTKDTSQSRYFCVFKKCSKFNQERHADCNAAINIGRRFLETIRKVP